MLDSVVVANVTIHEVSRHKFPSLFLKVDFEKAYDTVDWNFLYYMMRRMNFNEKWIGWIRGCLESASVSVLVNESPSDKFRLVEDFVNVTPFLFLIVEEGLNGLMR